jgi:hypothetical protein
VNDNGPQDITVIYDNSIMNESIVRTLFAPLAISLSNDSKNISAIPINKHNIEDALKKSKFIILLSHGGNGKIYANKPLTEYDCLLFRENNSGDLKYVYFSACYLGINGYKEKWENAMSPAKITIYNRESGILEHVLWIIFKAKNVIKENI